MSPASFQLERQLWLAASASPQHNSKLPSFFNRLRRVKSETAYTSPYAQSMDEPIDFDAASAAWMANKVRHGAMIYYRCEATLKDGHICSRTAEYAHALQSMLCKQHRALQVRAKIKQAVQESALPRNHIGATTTRASAARSNPNPVPNALATSSTTQSEEPPSRL
jgi:hypothetical protein